MSAKRHAPPANHTVSRAELENYRFSHTIASAIGNRGCKWLQIRFTNKCVQYVVETGAGDDTKLLITDSLDAAIEAYNAARG